MAYIASMRLVLFAFLLLLSACKETQADTDVGLYDPVAPAGSAFVRFINVGDTEGVALIEGKKYDSLKSDEVSAYFVAKKGQSTVEFSDTKKTASLAEGEFYSVVHGDDIISLKTIT